MKIVIETNDLSRQEAVALISFFATLANQVDAEVNTVLPAITPEAVAEAIAASKRTPDEAFGAPRTADEAFGAIVAQNEQPFTVPVEQDHDPVYIAPSATLEVDSAGVAWDPTIHATSEKTGAGVKKADGTWRARAKRGGTATAPTPDLVAPPPPTAAPVAAPTPPPAQSEFVTFMQKMQARSKTDATVTPRAVQWAINHGTTLPGLTSRPDLIAAITAEFGL